MIKSNEATIEQMNEAIASFEGRKRAVVNERGKAHHFWSDPTGTNPLYSETLHYHESWDELMPVVEKLQEPKLSDQGRVVRTAAQVIIYYKSCIITYEPDEESGDENDEARIQTQGETKIEAVYKAVYQFIQWYNNQTTTNE